MFSSVGFLQEEGMSSRNVLRTRRYWRPMGAQRRAMPHHTCRWLRAALRLCCVMRAVLSDLGGLVTLLMDCVCLGMLVLAALEIGRAASVASAVLQLTSRAGPFCDESEIECG